MDSFAHSRIVASFNRLLKFQRCNGSYQRYKSLLRPSLLRSWVQLPPGPFLSVVQLRYYFELISWRCRTKSTAMPMPYPPVCRQAMKNLQLLVDKYFCCRQYKKHVDKTTLQVQIEGTAHVSTLVGLGVCQTEDGRHNS